MVVTPGVMHARNLTYLPCDFDNVRRGVGNVCMVSGSILEYHSKLMIVSVSLVTADSIHIDCTL